MQERGLEKEPKRVRERGSVRGREKERARGRERERGEGERGRERERVQSTECRVTAQRAETGPPENKQGVEFQRQGDTGIPLFKPIIGGK